MKKLILFLFILPIFLNAQSDDGMGKISPVSPMLLLDTEMAEALGIKAVTSQDNKIKKGFPFQIFEWFDYSGSDGLTNRFRRDFKAESHFYDESILVLTSEETRGYDLEYANLVQHQGNKIAIQPETDGDKVLIYHGATKVYDITTGLVQATIFFDWGRPTSILINHYYANNQLQFVRDIGGGNGEPLVNQGVLEAYYPDGSVFENPLTDDGNAIIILNDQGEKEDECACIGQDIMEWGRGYLYVFLGKYTFLLEQIYQDDGLECCWE